MKLKKPLVSALLSFFVMCAIGLWVIFQSRSSTAAVGIIFLPFLGGISALLGYAFGKLNENDNPSFRSLSYIFLILNIVFIGYWISRGLQVRATYQQRDIISQARQKGIEESDQIIRSAFANNRGHEAEWLESEIEKRENDELFLIAALRTPFVKTRTLERLRHLPFESLPYLVYRHPNATPEMLTAIYKAHRSPNPYLDSIASNKNTPKEILKAIYEDQTPFANQDYSLGRNPSTPKEILMKLLKSEKETNLIALSQNPGLDCEFLKALEKTVSGFQPKSRSVQFEYAKRNVSTKVASVCKKSQ